MNELFKVKIHIEISQERLGYNNHETLRYQQEFDINARDFAGVAKILADLDAAVGTIERYKPVPPPT